MPELANTFNPNVRTLRLHWFSVRPSFDLLNPVARTEFAQQFLSEDRYYLDDQTGQACRFERLGRRFQSHRKGGFRPHGFWGKYMSQVAHSDYRGAWRGLAPSRVDFLDRKLLRVAPGIPELTGPSFTKVRAYPSCYLFPIGWSSGVVLELRGEMPLEQCMDLIQRLKSEPIFLWQGHSALSLTSVLAEMHKKIRDDLIRPAISRPQGDEPNPYLVVSPVKFEGQPYFQGDLQIDMAKASEMLAGRKLLDQQKVLVTADTLSLAATVFNQGTLVLAARPGKDRQVPGCASSNLKNALLSTMMMAKFHQNSRGHANEIVAAMRSEVAETFRQMHSFWLKPHFQAICAAHTGITNMLRTEAVVNQYFDFRRSTFTNTAIGPQARFLQASEKVFGLPTETKLSGGTQMATFNQANSTFTNTAQGETATFNQYAAQTNITQIARDLSALYTKAEARATSPAEQQDAAKIKTAAELAKKEDRGGVIAALKGIGEWGWGVAKEVLATTAVEGLKALVAG